MTSPSKPSLADTSPVVALTGATGYVGSLIARALEERVRVVRLTRRPAGPDDIAWSFDDTVTETADKLRERGATHLVHAAWDMSTSSPALLRTRCVEGSRRLFEASRQAGVGSIVFISTISAFEGARSAYGRCKLAVETLTRDAGGTVLRLGLVWGESGGGLYGSLRDTVRKAGVLPLIGSGRQPQYLLPEPLLADVVRRAVDGSLGNEGRPLTIAEPNPVPFRDLLLRIAAREGKPLRILPVPWPLIYGPLRTAELLGLRPKFRSDSVLSFVFQNPTPYIDDLRTPP